MNNAKPVLSIDFKKNRIRIHKVTLHLLGDPDYVQLLINPINKTIALKCSSAEDHLAHNTYLKIKPQKQCCELQSKILIDSLRDLYCNWDNKSSYRIIGELIESEHVAEFKMSNFNILN